MTANVAELIERAADPSAPIPLPEGLRSVPAFPDELLPERLRPWIADIAERVQCAPEFVAVPAMVALGSLIGRRVGIRPQARTDWTETPNLWGCIVGRPGVLKSPAMNAALVPLERLAARARAEHAERAAQDAAEAEARELRAALAKADAKKRLTRDRGADVSDLLTPQEIIATPPARRYSTNDTSYQALAELLMQNPNGLLVVRDELVSLLAALDAEENAEARGFYLTGWNGNQGYTVDRIGRGLGRHVEAVTLSLIGGTQPGKLASYINAANRGGAGDDGLIQRFGLLVWPDLGGEWRNVDRWPDHQAKRDAIDVFERLDGLSADAIGAEQDTDHAGEPTGTPFLRFAPDALEEFTAWRTELERTTLRGGDTPPALESHFAKYRKHVPALALICHLADGGTGPVSLTATVRAIAWAEYLDPHARRAYGSGTAQAAQAARAILKRIRTRALPDTFTARDVYRPQWSGLTDRDTVRKALLLLEDHGYVASVRQATAGAPATVYTVNPRAHA
jgi:putative DNA primase/helicase